MKTKTLSLLTLLILATTTLTCNEAYSYTDPVQQILQWMKRKPSTQQTKPAPAKKNNNKTDNTYNRKATAFLTDKRWKNGAVYNSSQKPKLSKYNCVGCCAYAADFVAYVFGKDSPRSGTEFRSLSQVRAGDLLVLSGPPHWIVVLSRNGNILTTTEGNWMGKVVAVKGAYTINGNTLMRNGKKFRTFSLGYHYM